MLNLERIAWREKKQVGRALSGTMERTENPEFLSFSLANNFSVGCESMMEGCQFWGSMSDVGFLGCNLDDRQDVSSSRSR